MRVGYFSTFWTILLDFVAWAAIHTGISYVFLRVPHRVLNPESWLLRTRALEAGGTLYEKLFRVRRWKMLLPSGGAWFRDGFSMKSLESRQPEYLRTWVMESCRAEMCHWAAIPSSLLFFLWNPLPVGFVMILYAIAFNLPCIVAQRYNRPRMLDILRKKDVIQFCPQSQADPGSEK